MFKKVLTFMVVFFASCFCFYLSQTAGNDQNKSLEIYSSVDNLIITNNHENSNSFESFDKFRLKTLMVEGDFDDGEYFNVIHIDDKTALLKFETEHETEIAYNKLSELSNVSVTIQDCVENSLTDNYSHFYNDWGYDAITIDPYMDYLEMNNVAEGEEMVVVVIDSGINTSHQYLKERILKDASGKYVGFAATSNGTKVRTTYTYSGYEFEDDHGHGTHVAGIICNSTPSNVKILPVKLNNSTGEFSLYTSDVYSMFSKIAEYAKTYNIVCVNMSWGGYWASTSFISYFSGYLDEYLINNSILPIASAGNDSRNADSHYPSALDNVVCVSAVTQSGASAVLASYSNYGSTVDVSAPGTNILSCGISQTNSAGTSVKYLMSGTSMATPYVSAVVALLYLDPDYVTRPSISTIKTRLYSNVTDLGNTGLDNKFGYGMVNLKYVLGDISYTATNTTVQYDGGYHNISVTNISAATYSIVYKFETESIYNPSVEGNLNFKNYTNGAKNVYFKISATGYKDTIGYATLTINKAPIGIRFLDQNSVYGNTPLLDNSKYSISSGQIYAGDSLNLNLTTLATNTSPVGNYNITGTINNSNYNPSFTRGILTITPRPISIGLKTQTSEYGDDIMFDSSAYIVTSALNVVNNDNLNLQFSTTATSNSDVGSYALTLVGYNNNYSITYSAGTYVISHKNIIVTSNQTGYYGDVPALNQTDYTTNVVINKQLLGLTLMTTATNISPVGTYNITFTTTNSNFSIDGSSSGRYIINRRKITIDGINQNETYGNIINLDQSKYVVTSGNIVNNDTINVTLSTTATQFSQVGDYTINIACSGENISNYQITKNSAILTINKRDIILTANNQTSIYGNVISLDSSKYSVTNIANNDTLYPTLSTTATSSSSVGNYEISIVCSASNYNITFVKGTLEITRRNITIVIANQTSVYGSEIVLSNNYTVTSQLKIVNNDNLNIELHTTATEISPLGSYPITLTYFNDNYNVDFVEGLLTITEKVVSITLLNQSGVYGNDVVLDNSKFTVNSHGVDAASLNIIIETSATNTSSVGNYLLFATSTNNNIKINFENAYYVVTKRPLSLTIDNQKFIYGDINLDPNGYIISNVVNNDSVSISLTTNATNRSPVANDYIISATCLNNNYSLPEITGKLEIERRLLRINISNQSEGYYGAISFNENDFTLLDDPINNDELNIKLTTTVTNNSPVGKYKISFSYSNNNYLITGEDAEFTVNPRPIEITINQTNIYGDEVVLNSQSYDVISIIKLVDGDNLNLELSTSATKTSVPGDYPINVVCLNNNYDITINSAILKILKRSITIRAEDATEIYVYGNPIILDQSKYSIYNLADDDILVVSVSTLADNFSSIGNYPIYPSCKEDSVSSKYEINYVNGYLTISQREIEVTISNQQTYYGEEVNLKPLYEVTSENNIVNGDNLNILLKTDATQTSSVGFYDIWLEYNNNNYKVNTVKGKLEIKQCDMIITIETQSGIYGDEINLDQSKFKTNIEIDVNSLGVTLKTNATKSSPVGDDYEIDLTYTNTNYDILIVKGTFEIKARPVSIVILNQTFTYGEVALDNTKFTANQQPIAEDFGIMLTTNALNTSHCGNDYEINFIYTNRNYEITASQFGVLTITPRVIEITAYQSSFYGDNVSVNNSNYIIVSGSIVNHDVLNLSSTCLANSKSVVGRYDIVFVSGNSNYLVVTLNATYEIIARPISVSIIQQKAYGDDVFLDADDYDIVLGNLIEGDSLDLLLQTSATKTDNVGTNYTISILRSNSNYNVNLVHGQFSIVKRKLVVESIQTAIYGEVVLNNNNYSFTEGTKAFGYDELNISFSTMASNLSGVGEYGLTLYYDNNNYDISLNSLKSKVVIYPRPITLSLQPSTSIFGDDVVLNKSYQIVSGSIVNNDNLNLQFSTTATKVSNVGSYLVNCNSSNYNYSLTTINNIHSIEKRKLTIKLLDQKSPHGIMFEIDQSKYELAEGSIVENTTPQIQIYSNAKRSSFIGKYDLMAKSNNDNYEIIVINAKLTLTPSFEDVAIVAIVIVIIVVGSIHIAKRVKEKKENKKLFDKYIGW